MPNLAPNAAPWGALAESRLGAENFERICRARNIQIMVRSTTRSPLDYTIIPAGRAAEFAARIDKLLHEDKLYTISYERKDTPSDVEILLKDADPQMEIRLYLNKDRIEVLYSSNVVHRIMDLRLAPIAAPFLDLVRSAELNNPVAQRLAFRALPSSPSSPRAKIPFTILSKISAIRPGIRRAEATQFLGGEGGVFSREWQQFVVRDSANEKGLLVKIGIGFAPASSRICWIDGKGYTIDAPRSNQESLMRFPGDDIVIRVAEPFYEQFRYD